jgi:hypothetical protein
VLQPLLHDALRAGEMQCKGDLQGHGVGRWSAADDEERRTSHSSPMASNQPLKLSMLRGKPSTRKFQEEEEKIALESKLTVTSTGTILPSLMKLEKKLA